MATSGRARLDCPTLRCGAQGTTLDTRGSCSETALPMAQMTQVPCQLWLVQGPLLYTKRGRTGLDKATLKTCCADLIGHSSTGWLTSGVSEIPQMKGPRWELRGGHLPPRDYSLTPQPHSQIPVGAQDFAFLTNSQTMLMLLVQDPYFKKQGPGPASHSPPVNISLAAEQRWPESHYYVALPSQIKISSLDPGAEGDEQYSQDLNQVNGTPEPFTTIHTASQTSYTVSTSGNRSTSSTKSRKVMNPTGQDQKEARKRESKNKKQRMMVQAAVLKMKHPKQIIGDMEKLDEMEINPVQQPQVNEKVVKDKHKKLRTNERILRSDCLNVFYNSEKKNPDIYKELKKLELECEQKRAQLSQYFDAFKNAQHVEVESILLPDMAHAPSNILIQDIPLPGAQLPSILKKISACGPPTPAVSVLPFLGHGVVSRLPPGRKPPGLPHDAPPPQILQIYGPKVSFALGSTSASVR
ncbi:LOW QUALITY PROTEIN: uncharacterized protein WM277_015014 [Molossus nigricans]